MKMDRYLCAVAYDYNYGLPLDVTRSLFCRTVLECMRDSKRMTETDFLVKYTHAIRSNK